MKAAWWSVAVLLTVVAAGVFWWRAGRSDAVLDPLQGATFTRLTNWEGGGRERQLTSLGRGFTIGDFDIAANGREVVFDRSREESDIVLIERPAQ